MRWEVSCITELLKEWNNCCSKQICKKIQKTDTKKTVSRAPTKKWTQIHKVPSLGKVCLWIQNPALHLFLQYSSFSRWNGHGIWPLTTGRPPRMDAKVWTINMKSDSALIPALYVSGFPHCCIHWNLGARNFTVRLWSVQGSKTFTKNVTF